MTEQTAHERLMAELIAAMAAGKRKPLHEIKVTVSAMDLDHELGVLRMLRAASPNPESLQEGDSGRAPSGQALAKAEPKALERRGRKHD